MLEHFSYVKFKFILINITLTSIFILMQYFLVCVKLIAYQLFYYT